MKQLILLSLIIFFTHQVAFSQQTAKGKIKVSGVVRDNSTFLPITHATVQLSASNLTAATDKKGRFELMVSPVVLRKTKKSLIVTKNKYWGKTISVSPENFTDLDIQLAAAKQRLIVTSDIGGTDPDDEQSMVHLLVASNEIDIEGIVCGLAWLDDKLGVSTMNGVLESYKEVYPNLKLHSSDFPSYKDLIKIVQPGQVKSRMAGVGEGKDSPGSELIIAAVDKKGDPRPVWLNAWGGANTIAQALWKVKNTRTPEAVEQFINKIRIYDVLGQDDAGAWIAKSFPNLIYIRNTAIYGWAPSDQWVKENVQSKLPLGAKYRNRIWATEGDSPAFFQVYNNGLSDANKIDQGGWGGRFSLEEVGGIRSMDIAQKSGVNESVYDPYFMHTNTSEGIEAINLWKQQIYNDFAARMLWTVTDNYKMANHHPKACIGNDCTKQVLEYTVKPGSVLELDAGKSSDPDQNDKLNYEWKFYQNPGSYKNGILLTDNKSSKFNITIPENTAGETIHIILMVSDNGKPALTAYRRIILQVKPK